MELTVLAVPDCPSVALLEDRLAQALQGRPGVAITHHQVASQQEAARRGMCGSPTILVNGTDPFAAPGQAASMSCRLYRDGGGKLEGAPTVSQLREAVRDSNAGTIE